MPQPVAGHHVETGILGHGQEDRQADEDPAQPVARLAVGHQRTRSPRTGRRARSARRRCRGHVLVRQAGQGNFGGHQRQHDGGRDQVGRWARPAGSAGARFAHSKWLIRIAAWRPRPSGRGGNAAPPPRKCQWYSIVCSHVQVPAAPHPRPAGGAAGPLRPRPVRMEPGRRAARPLAPGPGERAGLPGAVPAAHRRAGGAPVAGRRLPDGAAAGAAGLRPGDDGVLRPGQPGRAAVVAQGRAGRGIPDRRARPAVGCAPGVPEGRPGLGAQGRVGPVPLVPRGAAGREVLPGDDGPGGPLACRLRGDPRAGAGPG